MSEFKIIDSGFENKKAKAQKTPKKNSLLNEIEEKTNNSEEQDYNSYKYNFNDHYKKEINEAEIKNKELNNENNTENNNENTETNFVSKRTLIILIIWALIYKLFIYWEFGLM